MDDPRVIADLRSKTIGLPVSDGGGIHTDALSHLFSEQTKVQTLFLEMIT